LRPLRSVNWQWFFCPRDAMIGFNGPDEDGRWWNWSGKVSGRGVVDHSCQ
jgi:hypothetical protein